MTDGTKRKVPPRRRGKPIEVWVTDEEKEAITERAEQAGMSRSGYLRALGLNSPIRSVVDLKAVADLAKVNGDLGRVAGLLKLWLAEKRGQGASPVEVERMMIEFRELQSCIRGKMSAIVYVKNGDGAIR
ncbi:plasmid mobilization protein [Pseudomonas phoenicis]|uniref:plasmid mobilization protein n=1 Tax=unclassified Pseudomonas TaxID=196821 RepID=UPI00399F6EE1